MSALEGDFQMVSRRQILITYKNKVGAIISNVIGYRLYDVRFDFLLFQSVETGYGIYPWWFFPHR